MQGFLGEIDFPCAVVKPRQLILIGSFPIRERANQPDFACVGGILTKCPASLRKMVKAEIFIGISEIGKGSVCVLCQLVEFPDHVFMATFYGRLIWLQPWIVAKNR